MEIRIQCKSGGWVEFGSLAEAIGSTAVDTDSLNMKVIQFKVDGDWYNEAKFKALKKELKETKSYLRVTTRIKDSYWRVITKNVYPEL